MQRKYYPLYHIFVHNQLISNLRFRFLETGLISYKYAIWVGSDTTLLNNAISSRYFSRIHASGSIAFKAEDVHADGIPYFSSHPVDNRAQWDLVKKYNIDGISTDKPDVALFVYDTTIPTCNIKYPVTGDNFYEGETITIKASVGDSDSSIMKVEFHRNGRLIGQDTSYPYTYSMSGVATGNYALTARVFDNGKSKKSAPVFITVEIHKPAPDWNTVR